MSSQNDDYEAVVKTGNTGAVAAFAPARKGILAQVQHMLHLQPALVPLFVLAMSIVTFGLLLGTKFFSPFALTLFLPETSTDHLPL